jgi:hypothetical protein
MSWRQLSQLYSLSGVFTSPRRSSRAEGKTKSFPPEKSARHLQLSERVLSCAGQLGELYSLYRWWFTTCPEEDSCENFTPYTGGGLPLPSHTTHAVSKPFPSNRGPQPYPVFSAQRYRGTQPHKHQPLASPLPQRTPNRLHRSWPAGRCSQLDRPHTFSSARGSYSPSCVIHWTTRVGRIQRTSLARLLSFNDNFLLLSSQYSSSIAAQDVLPLTNILLYEQLLL